VDAVGWDWMMTSQLGKHSQLGLGFAAGLIGLSFPLENLCIIVYLHELHYFSVVQGEWKW